jgi:hypothetical protein
MKRINFIVLAVLAFGFALFAVPLPAQFAYVANRNSDNISAYSINPKTGVLSAVTGSPFATGTNPFSARASPERHVPLCGELWCRHCLGLPYR